MMGMYKEKEDSMMDEQPRREALMGLIKAMQDLMMKGYGEEEINEGDMPSEGEGVEDQYVDEENSNMLSDQEDMEEGMEEDMEEGDGFREEIQNFMQGKDRKPKMSGATVEVGIMSAAPKKKSMRKKTKKG